ncbi:hypothetical protein HMPREF3264_12190 [Staphylococcus sp. HMSC62A08]|nr:hypothetical protein HMPREF3264_12190 [Staphylococcus sp. HMSC62A08]
MVGYSVAYFLLRLSSQNLNIVTMHPVITGAMIEKKLAPLALHLLPLKLSLEVIATLCYSIIV